MTGPDPIPETALRGLRRPVAMTRLGMAAERGARAFWLAWTIALAVLGALMLGAQDALPLEVVWGGAALAAPGLVVALGFGIRRFRWPTRTEALDRLDRTLPGRPIAALADHQAIGAGDTASEAVWQAHLARMAARVRGARAVAPDLRLPTRDPYALRYAALLLFLVAVLFGSVWRVATVGGVLPGAAGPALAAGPAWEGWIEPPAYTGRPSLYLNDISRAGFAVPVGSRVTLRLYGEVGALTVAETVSGRTGEPGSAAAPTQEFEIARSGTLEIRGRGGRAWEIEVLPDTAPSIRLDGPPERTVTGEMRQPYAAADDYGVTAAQAEITLDLGRVDRRHGLTPEPEPREPILIDLPLPITGDRAEFSEMIVEDFAEHPWANLPVTIRLTAVDAADQTGLSEPVAVVLPGRRFFDPLAEALIEQRRDLLWSKENAGRVVHVLRALSWRPEGLWQNKSAYLMLRVALSRLDQAADAGLDAAGRQEAADALWQIAVLIEDGDLADAAERLARAQERLAEAIENGATDEEIAHLMDELRQAMDNYMRQLAEQAEEDPNQQAQNMENMRQITGDQLQEMLDRLQQLMEEGRMAEAQRLLEQLRQMMENMRVVRGQQGQGEGQQAMNGLGETLREQQGLSDEAFRDLQEQFNQGQQGRGQQGQGQQGRGQQGQGQQGQGQQGQGGQGQDGRFGQGQNPGQEPGLGQGGEQAGPGDPRQSLADRQEALRRELERQREGLPGAGTPEGQAAREALGRAGRAMDGAEEALRQDDFAGALDRQAEAIEALREGMRELGEALAQEQGQPGRQGETLGQAGPDGMRDPLGRESGANGPIGTDESLLQGETVYQRARELLEELRRRAADRQRSAEELEYLRRLLERF